MCLGYETTMLKCTPTDENIVNYLKTHKKRGLSPRSSHFNENSVVVITFQRCLPMYPINETDFYWLFKVGHFRRDTE